MIKIETNKLKNETKPKINSAISNLNQASSLLKGIKIPDNFYYLSDLKGMPSQIDQIVKDVKGINKYIDQKIQEFESARKSILSSNLNWAPSYMQGTTNRTNKTNKTNKNADPLNWSPSYQGGNIPGVGYSGYGTSIVSFFSTLFATNTKKKNESGLVKDTTKETKKIVADLKNTNAQVCNSGDVENEVLNKALMIDVSDDNEKSSANRKRFWDIAKTLNWDHATDKQAKSMLLKSYGINVNPWDIKKINSYGNDYWAVILHDGISVTFHLTWNSEKNYNEGYIIVDYGDGIELHISLYPNDYMKKNIIKDGKPYGYPFGQEEYGGNQMTFRDNNAYLCQDEKIQETVKKYWPNATDEDIELLLYKFCNTGCGYTAMANAVFEEYKNKPDDFEKVFGFPMYIENKQGERDYNYEYLTLNYFGYIWGKYGGYDIKELTEGINSNSSDIALTGEKIKGISTGSTSEVEGLFDNCLKEEYGIDALCQNTISPWENYAQIKEAKKAEINVKADKNNYMDIYNQLKENHNHIIVSSCDFDLYKMNGEKFNSKPVGGHAMYVDGVSDDGKYLIVKSWGNEYYLDLVNTNPSRIVFTTVDF